jgi:pre-mRNA-splicing factor ATP-dependent RNA helicase DHX15/PRP43
LVNFDYFDSPAPETLMRALELLNYLGAIDDNGDLTNIGYQMSELPLDPQLAKLILVSPDYNCSNEIITIVACLSVPQLFLRPLDNVKAADTAKAQFNHNDSDHITMLNAYSTYERIPVQQQQKWCWDNYINDRAMKSITNVRQQLVSICNKLDIPIITSDQKGDGSYAYTDIRKVLTSSMYMQVAYRQRSGDYITIKDNQIVSLHPSTVIATSRPTWVLYEEFVLTTKNFIRTNTVTSVDWLIEVASHYFDMSNFPECETKNELELAYRRLAQQQNQQRQNRQQQNRR